jgi:hypothetical protein
MASPKIEVFFLYDASTGVPLTGATPVFDTYKDDLGANLAQPSITEIGGGAYKFTPDITTTPDRGIAYVIDGGATASPRRVARYVRPEDYSTDLVVDLWDMEFGKWQIGTSGPDINRLVTYRTDGVTILKKFNLFDSAGVPTSINPFRRDPI